MEYAVKWARMTGLEIAQGILTGNIPADDPMAVTMNFALAEAREGFSAFEGTPLALHQNLSTTIHGSWPMAILDSASVMAVVTTLPMGTLCATSTFEMKFHRPLQVNKRYRAEGRQISTGRTLGHAEGKLIEIGTGKLMASCTCSCSFIDISGR